LLELLENSLLQLHKNKYLKFKNKWINSQKDCNQNLQIYKL